MIQTILLWILYFALALILQTTLVSVVGIVGVEPDLLIICLFLFCLKFGIMPGVFIGFFFGLVLDLYSPSMLGQNALAKTSIGFFMGLFNEKLMRTDFVLKLVILVFAFIFHDLIFNSVQYIKNGDSLLLLLRELFAGTIPRIIYSVVILIIIYVWNFTVKPNIKR